MLNHIIYQIAAIYSALKKIGFKNLIIKYDKSSDNIVLFFPKSLIDLLNYFTRAWILHDLSIIFYLVKSGQTFCFKTITRFGRIRNKNIYYQFTYFTNTYNFEDHSNYSYYLLKKLEKNSCILYPKSDEILYWENKVFMHKEFERLNINCPKTTIVNFKSDLLKIEHSFPLLIKEPYANHSKGIYMIKSLDELISKSAIIFTYSNYFLIQELVNMSKDSRTVVVNGEIVYHYWRSKEISKEFKTTSTSNGAKLDFKEHSEKNKKIILDYTKKLGLSQAAYDITFENDDENNPPIVLEVSSSFLLNPIPEGKFLDLPYLNYKKRLLKFGSERAKQMLDFKFNKLNNEKNKSL
jgi:glutathione synthase/RimK-type ligase-like ATP-grasp enzyme